MQIIPGNEGQIDAVSFYKSRHYFTCFHVAKRPDADTKFAFIVTCYATNKKEYIERYEKYLNFVQNKYGSKTG